MTDSLQISLQIASHSESYLSLSCQFKWFFRESIPDLIPSWGISHFLLSLAGYRRSQLSIYYSLQEGDTVPLIFAFNLLDKWSNNLKYPIATKLYSFFHTITSFTYNYIYLALGEPSCCEPRCSSSFFMCWCYSG